MATPAYRNLLRAARIAFQGDERVLTAARQQIRTGFREKASLPSSHPTVAPSVQYANEVAEFLKANVVQGRKEGNGETYSMFRPASPRESHCRRLLCFSRCLGLGMLTFGFPAELRIHEHTERGDNDSIKLAGGKTVGAGGGCCQSQ